MIGEADIAGMFVSWILIWALVALALGALLRRILTAVGFYRLVWHPALFDLAMFVILWGAVSRVAAGVAGPLGAG